MKEYYRPKLYDFGASAQVSVFMPRLRGFCKPIDASQRMGAKKMGKKTTHAFSGPTTKAFLLLSLLLISSAVLLSQSDKLFAQAASSNIRGTIVLSDKGQPSTIALALSVGNLTAPVALPGSACTIVLTGCNGGINGYSGTQGPSLRFDATVILNPVASGVSCMQSNPIATTGGLHTVMVTTPSSNSIHYVAVAYDCTP